MIVFFISLESWGEESQQERSREISHLLINAAQDSTSSEVSDDPAAAADVFEERKQQPVQISQTQSNINEASLLATNFTGDVKQDGFDEIITPDNWLNLSDIEKKTIIEFINKRGNITNSILLKSNNEEIINNIQHNMSAQFRNGNSLNLSDLKFIKKGRLQRFKEFIRPA